MSVTGKAFEEHFKEDWKKSFPDGDIIRLYDVTSGYLNISNISDFIGYSYPNMFYLECKVHKGASIPFDKISQYPKLLEKANIYGIRSGVILYLYEKYRVFYIPATTIKRMKEDGKKSVGIKALEEGYNIIEIPSKKLRVFTDSDYSVLQDLKEGE